MHRQSGRYISFPMFDIGIRIHIDTDIDIGSSLIWMFHFTSCLHHEKEEYILNLLTTGKPFSSYATKSKYPDPLLLA